MRPGSRASEAGSSSSARRSRTASWRRTISQSRQEHAVATEGQGNAPAPAPATLGTLLAMSGTRPATERGINGPAALQPLAQRGIGEAGRIGGLLQRHRGRPHLDEPARDPPAPALRGPAAVDGRIGARLIATDQRMRGRRAPPHVAQEGHEPDTFPLAPARAHARTAAAVQKALPHLVFRQAACTCLAAVPGRAAAGLVVTQTAAARGMAALQRVVADSHGSAAHAFAMPAPPGHPAAPDIGLVLVQHGQAPEAQPCMHDGRRRCCDGPPPRRARIDSDGIHHQDSPLLLV